MSIKEKTIKHLESKVDEVEGFIEENGVGSGYLSKASKLQRGLNVGLAIGGVIGLAGLSTWLMIKE